MSEPMGLEETEKWEKMGMASVEGNEDLMWKGLIETAL